MPKFNTQKLREELLLAGASAAEMSSLLETARSLRRLRANTTASPRARRSRPERPRLRPLIAGSTIAVLLGLSLVTFAQASLPGSVLYPLKRASENTAIAIDPAYRASLMMRRSEEVKTLITQGASSRLVLATLAAYQSEAKLYMARDASYGPIDYCKRNLTQAAMRAPGTEQAAIQRTLAALPT